MIDESNWQTSWQVGHLGRSGIGCMPLDMAGYEEALIICSGVHEKLSHEPTAVREKWHLKTKIVTVSLRWVTGCHYSP